MAEPQTLPERRQMAVAEALPDSEFPRTAMARQFTWVLALVLICAPAVRGAARIEQQGRPEKAQGSAKDVVKDKAQPAAATNRPPDNRRKWWLHDRVELGITDKQSSDINDIFESTLPKLRDARQQLDKAEEELSATIKEHKADVATLSLILDRVESARTQHNKLRTLMLYRMHMLLSDEQRTKLHALFERWNRERRDKDPSPDRRHRP
jgi:Spy/CpxP family protein refolding chaperone